MALQTFLPAVKTHMQAVLDAAVTANVIPADGAVYGYNEWPAGLLIAPSVLIGTVGGDVEYSVGGPNIDHHNVRIWIYFPKFTLAIAMGMAVPMIDLVKKQFAGDIQLGGLVDHFLPPEAPAPFYEGPGMLEYAGQEQVGMLFNFDAKENTTGDFTVAA
jgi:hypothetical protein